MTDHVLAARGTAQKSEVYHLPSKDNPDRPKCGGDCWTQTEWNRVDPEGFPNRRVCVRCSSDSYHNPHTGERTATRLSKMDPDDVGGSA